jgi:hypothetical protein
MPIFMIIGWTVLKLNGNLQYTYLQTSTFIFRYHPRFALAQCGWMDVKSPCSWKLWFWHYYQCRPFLPPYLRVLEVLIYGIRITETNIHINYSENHDAPEMLSSIIFTCHPFQPMHISLLKVHLNGIGNITIHLNLPKNYEFHTNGGRYYFTCISIPIPEMVWEHLNVIGSVTICLKDQVSYKA